RIVGDLPQRLLGRQGLLGAGRLLAEIDHSAWYTVTLRRVKRGKGAPLVSRRGIRRRDAADLPLPIREHLRHLARRDKGDAGSPRGGGDGTRWMFGRPFLAGAVLGAVGLAVSGGLVPSLGQSAAPPRPPVQHRFHAPGQHVEGRIAFLKAELKITDAQ